MALRKTKLIATLGPACDDPRILEAMIAGGMDVARLNLSHGTLDEQRVRLERLREVVTRAGANVIHRDVKPTNVLIDTRGFEIRTGRLDGGAAVLAPGMRYTLRGSPGLGDERGVSVSFTRLAEAVSIGDRIVIDDGKIELLVEKISGDEVECEVTCGGTLRDRKGVNLPDTDLQRDAPDEGEACPPGEICCSDNETCEALAVCTGTRDTCTDDEDCTAPATCGFFCGDTDERCSLDSCTADDEAGRCTREGRHPLFRDGPVDVRFAPFLSSDGFRA